MSRPIFLFINNAAVRSYCELCDMQCGPCGVDVGISMGGRGGIGLVCDRCADERRPGLAEVGRSLAWLYDQEPAHMLLLERLVAAANDAFDAIEAGAHLSTV